MSILSPPDLRLSISAAHTLFTLCVARFFRAFTRVRSPIHHGFFFGYALDSLSAAERFTGECPFIFADCHDAHPLSNMISPHAIGGVCRHSSPMRCAYVLSLRARSLDADACHYGVHYARVLFCYFADYPRYTARAAFTSAFRHYCLLADYRRFFAIAAIHISLARRSFRPLRA